MLYEYKVINAVCHELENRGFQIDQKLKPSQRGIDIIASKNEPNQVQVFIEAKGETSSLESSNHYGKPFSSSQVRVHVAKAVYKTLEILSSYQGASEDVMAGIALPYTKLHLKMEKAVHPILMNLGIVIFWVYPDGSVYIEADLNSEYLTN